MAYTDIADTAYTDIADMAYTDIADTAWYPKKYDLGRVVWPGQGGMA